MGSIPSSLGPISIMAYGSQGPMISEINNFESLRPQVCMGLMVLSHINVAILSGFFVSHNSSWSLGDYHQSCFMVITGPVL